MRILNPALDSDLEIAAAALRNGDLVAIPTETVYGLAANALSDSAVRKIFAAKGRPANRPVIVHTATMSEARALALDWPLEATALATAFWPGPLTIVVHRSSEIPDVVAAGGSTVAFRVPDHPVALELIRRSGVPLAAPSANLFTRLSPTLAEHVVESLEGVVDYVVDGGATEVGIESTIVDLTGEVPEILRPGQISRIDLERVLGRAVKVGSAVDGESERHRAPGRGGVHYSPVALVQIMSTGELQRADRDSLGAAIISWSFDAGGVRLSGAPREYARELYAALRRADASGVERILVEAVPTDAEWDGVRDRLARAAQS